MELVIPCSSTKYCRKKKNSALLCTRSSIIVETIYAIFNLLRSRSVRSTMRNAISSPRGVAVYSHPDKETEASHEHVANRLCVSLGCGTRGRGFPRGVTFYRFCIITVDGGCAGDVIWMCYVKLSVLFMFTLCPRMDGAS